MNFGKIKRNKNLSALDTIRDIMDLPSLIMKNGNTAILTRRIVECKRWSSVNWNWKIVIWHCVESQNNWKLISRNISSPKKKINLFFLIIYFLFYIASLQFSLIFLVWFLFHNRIFRSLFLLSIKPLLSSKSVSIQIT